MIKNELKLSRKLKFGIELEVKTSMREAEIADLLRSVGVACSCHVGNVHGVLKKNWKVVRDGSISNGWEIVSPPLSSFNDVEKVCKVLEENGVTVDKSCGFHVHHEIKDLNKKQIENIYEIYNKYEVEVIDQLLPMSRRVGNACRTRWCKPVRQIMDDIRGCDSIEKMINHINIGGGRGGSHYQHCRYRSINFRAYVVYGTIEFRHHSGTIEFEKIRNWVLLTHKIIESACVKDKIKPVSDKRRVKWNEEVRHSSYDFYKELGINGTVLSDYLGRRRKALKAE